MAKTYMQSFPSVADCIAASEKPYPENMGLWERIEAGTNIALHRGPAVWYGVASRDEALRILQSGQWPEGVRRMQDALGQIETDVRPRSVRRVRVRRDSGAEVDVTEYWRGRGDVAWTACKRDMRAGPQSVTVAVNLSIQWQRNAADLFWRGAAVLALADKLTAAGYNVEIIVLNPASSVGVDGRSANTEVVVKDARAPLDLNALAVTTCLAAFFRVTMFKQICCYPFKVKAGLGHEVVYRKLCPVSVDPRRMFIADDSASTVEGARKFVQESLDSLEKPE